MPTPAFFERHAAQLYSYRWRLGPGAVAAYSAAFGLLALSTFVPVRLPFSGVYLLVALAPILIWCWGLTLLGFWFHPDRGTIRPDSPWFLRAPRFVQSAASWYFALFLTIWFLSPILLVGVILDDG